MKKKTLYAKLVVARKGSARCGLIQLLDENGEKIIATSMSNSAICETPHEMFVRLGTHILQAAARNRADEVIITVPNTPRHSTDESQIVAWHRSVPRLTFLPYDTNRFGALLDSAMLKARAYHDHLARDDARDLDVPDSETSESPAIDGEEEEKP